MGSRFGLSSRCSPGSGCSWLLAAWQASSSGPGRFKLIAWVMYLLILIGAGGSSRRSSLRWASSISRLPGSGLLAMSVVSLQPKTANTLSRSSPQDGSNSTTRSGTSYADGMSMPQGTNSMLSVPQIARLKCSRREGNITILLRRTVILSLQQRPCQRISLHYLRVKQSWFRRHRCCGFFPVHFFRAEWR